MRIIDYIHIAIKNLSRRKGTVILNTILITIAVCICILAFSFTSSFGGAMNRAIVNNVSYRTVVLRGVPTDKIEEVMSEIEKIDHVSKVLTSDYYERSIYLKDDIVQGYENDTIGIIGANEDTQPTVINGRQIKEGEENVCLVPEKIYLDTYGKSYDEDKYINGNELLGKTLKFEYYSTDSSNGSENSFVNATFEVEFEVVGVYDAIENMIDGNDFFVPYSNVEKIVNDIKDNEVLDTNVSYADPYIMAIVDKATNTDTVLEEVKELGYVTMLRSTTNIEIVYIINVVICVVLAILVSIILINITASNVKSMDERKYEIGMLKAIGYKNKVIRKMLLFENLTIGIISYIIGLIISIIAMTYVQNKVFINNYQYTQINFKINLLVCVLALIISVGVPYISTSLATKKTLKRTPVSLNKER